MAAADKKIPGLQNFVQDAPRDIARPRPAEDSLIADVVVERLIANSDARGDLIELLTTRDGLAEPIVHVYQVIAAAGSVRGWVYHKWQHDRLTFTLGDFEVRLFDIRSDSPTYGRQMSLRVGAAQPTRLRIPPLVAHMVRNLGAAAAFVNMPTRVYDPADPDKFRHDPTAGG